MKERKARGVPFFGARRTNIYLKRRYGLSVKQGSGREGRRGGKGQGVGEGVWVLSGVGAEWGGRVLQFSFFSFFLFFFLYLSFLFFFLRALEEWARTQAKQIEASRQLAYQLLATSTVVIGYKNQTHTRTDGLGETPMHAPARKRAPQARWPLSRQLG